MSNSHIALEKFKEGFNCAQSVLFCYADKLNLSSDLALRMATGFGAGMGRKQEVCGAVTGGILVLNLTYGRGEADEKHHQAVTYQKVAELMERFEAKHQTVNCKQLLSGCELSDSLGQQEFQSNHLVERCHGYVESVVQILDEII